MKIPRDSIRNANPGALVGDRAWTNPGRNRPGPTFKRDGSTEWPMGVEGDQLARLDHKGNVLASIVRNTGETRRTIIEVGTAVTETLEVLRTVPVDVLQYVESWEYKSPPTALVDDPEVFVYGGQLQFYDAERATAIYRPFRVAWTEEVEGAQAFLNLFTFMGGGPRTIAATVTRELVGRVRAVRYSDRVIPSPDMEEISTAWRAAEKIRAAEKVASRAARKARRSSAGFWQGATVRGCFFTPDASA